MIVAEKEILKFSRVVEKALRKNDFNGAMAALELCAELRYRENQIIYDRKLENYLSQLVDKAGEGLQNGNDCDGRTVLFYDGFGLDHRGLSYIYVRALVNLKYKVILVLDGRHETSAEKMERLVRENCGKVYYLRNQSYDCWCREFAEIVAKHSPENAFLYSSPYDTAAMVSFGRFRGKISSFLVNSTDQEYWLGTDVTDYIIEFRDFGASISKEYRNIDPNRLIKLPFYPYVDESKEFMGYPFPYHGDMVVIFSGGQLYKTRDENQTYYRIVHNALEKHPNVVFWYARGGPCEELEALQEKFPGRVFHTKERSDLLQVLKHCDIYLNTYPIAGGLMMQYSALAGKLPVGLRTIAGEADDILIDQEQHRVFFDTVDELQGELDRLVADPVYRQSRNDEMKEGTVISESEFTVQLQQITENQHSDYLIRWKHYPIEELLEVYNRINRGVTSKLFYKHSRRYLLRYEFATIVGNQMKYIASKIKEKLRLR